MDGYVDGWIGWERVIITNREIDRETHAAKKAKEEEKWNEMNVDHNRKFVTYLC